MKLESYLSGTWQSGQGDGRTFVNPVTGEELGRVDASGLDAAAAMDYARDVGGPALRALGFAERGALLKAVAGVLAENRDRYGEIARLNSGNTASDAAIDIDGAIATLKVYARLGASLGDARTIIEPGREQLAREPVFFARHVWNSRPGVSLHINAFNFPAWGLWEKAAVALLAGVPSLSKPATATAWLAVEMMRDVAAAQVVPEGALNLLCGDGAALTAALQPMDSLAFTGSAETAAALRAHPAVLERAPRLSIEADSINATILGPDVSPDSPLFDLAVREVVKALTVKAGQLCTNIRRILVPAAIVGAFQDAVVARLSTVTVGDPAAEGVRMGPLVNEAQREAACAGLAGLSTETRTLCGGGAPKEVAGADPQQGSFLAPTLLHCADPMAARLIHETEVFGPCATVMACQPAEAPALAARGGGSLAVSLFSNDASYAAETLQVLAPWHGRLLIVDEQVGRNHTGHAIVMPQCVHGGPGRAGGGEELGGLRGLRLHLQRSALQASEPLLTRIGDAAAVATL